MNVAVISLANLFTPTSSSSELLLAFTQDLNTGKVNAESGSYCTSSHSAHRSPSGDRPHRNPPSTRKPESSTLEQRTKSLVPAKTRRKEREREKNKLTSPINTPRRRDDRIPLQPPRRRIRRRAQRERLIRGRRRADVQVRRGVGGLYGRGDVVVFARSFRSEYGFCGCMVISPTRVS